eukprot:jgi/Mesvir1/18320/Mv18473-RA.1
MNSTAVAPLQSQETILSACFGTGIKRAFLLLAPIVTGLATAAVSLSYKGDKGTARYMFFVHVPTIVVNVLTLVLFLPSFYRLGLFKGLVAFFVQIMASNTITKVYVTALALFVPPAQPLEPPPSTPEAGDKGASDPKSA